MHRLRTWLSIFASFAAFLLAFAGFSASAKALEAPALAGAPTAPEAPARSGDSDASLLLPYDVPVVHSSAQLHLPPLPAEYVTKDFGWLRFSFPPRAAERVAPLFRDANAVRAELAEVLGQPPLDHVEIRLAETASDMARLAPQEASPPDYADGVAYPRARLIVLSMLAPRGGEAVDLDRVFRHELAHLALEDAVAGQHVPLWFNEGLAMALSGESRFDRLKVLWNATVSGTLLPLSELDRSFPSDHFEVNIAYAESADFVGFLMRKSDKLRFAAMVRRVREGTAFDRALADAYGDDLRKLEFQWRSDLERRYTLLPTLAGGGIVWVAAIGGLSLAYAKKRRREKAILARWEREEAVEDAVRAAEAAADSLPQPRAHVAISHGSSKVEHDGCFHTLH
ncbi:MAG: peptidase MA family metallohydrolase [Polyangiaceae bacterium]|nr:peptidase MA family metallohydrolase [Polyangiaceae bacterium]